MGNIIGITLICAIVAVLYVICTLTCRIYKNLYFRGKKFCKLNRDTDDIAELYEKIKNKSMKLKNNVYVDFSPSINEQLEMLDNNDEFFKYHKKLPARTYLCTSEIFKQFEEQKYDMLCKYCGFSGHGEVLSHMFGILEQANDLGEMVGKFEQNYEPQIKNIKKSLPLLIKIFAKQEALLLLGLEMDKNWKDDLYPKYIFRNHENQKQTIEIILTPEEIDRMIKYFTVY